jgi:hypothetical protein
VSAMLEREFPTLGFYKSLKPIQNG